MLLWRVRALVFIVVLWAVGSSGEELPRFQSLPCFAPIAKQARIGSEPLSFEEAFFDGPYRRCSGDNLIDRGFQALHRFEDLQAERIFREATTRKPSDAMGYIGLLLANQYDSRRAVTFLEMAKSRAKSKEEKLWVTAYDEFLKNDDKISEVEAKRQLVARFEEFLIRETNPKIHRWMLRLIVLHAYRDGIPVSSRLGVDKLLSELDSGWIYRLLLWEDSGEISPIGELSGENLSSAQLRIAADFARKRTEFDLALRLLRQSIELELKESPVMPGQSGVLSSNTTEAIRLLSDLGRQKESERLADWLLQMPLDPVPFDNPRRRIKNSHRESGEWILEQSKAPFTEGVFWEGRKNTFRYKAEKISRHLNDNRKRDALFLCDRNFRDLWGQADRDLPILDALSTLGSGSDREVKPFPLPVRQLPVAKGFRLPRSTGEAVNLSDYRGKPLIVIFFLGGGCPHCVEQLMAFAPRYEAIRDAGLEVVSISTDVVSDLKKGLEQSSARIEFPICSDAKLDVFQSWQVYDEFMDRPLHGTFVLDSEGRIRWEQRSHEPFLRVDFLLEEVGRMKL